MVPVLEDVLCDRCGKSTKTLSPGDTDQPPVPEFGVMYANWEEPQPGWGNRTLWEVHLCKGCWYTLIPSILSEERLQEVMDGCEEQPHTP